MSVGYLGAEKAPAGQLADAVVAETLSWIGTPYRHQGDCKHIGCDCLGLVRGVWQATYGHPLEPPGAYAPDWAEAGGHEILLSGVRRHFRERSLRDLQPGDLLVFRWRPHLPAKHTGILVAPRHFVHAYQGAGAVARSALVPQWLSRIAGVFAFPDI